jgi:Flp pilus assembly protein TadG
MPGTIPTVPLARLRRTRPRLLGPTRRGTAATELALILPFLALVFLAALDFGRVFRVTQVLQQSAFAAALAASGTSEPSGSPNAADAQAAAVANGAGLNPPLTADNVTIATDDTAGTVTVTVAYDFALLTPVLAGASQVHLTRTLVLRRAPVPGQ